MSNVNVSLKYSASNPNALDQNTTILRYPTLSADNNVGVVVNDTVNVNPLTAIATSVTFSQVNNGDNGFGIWTKAFQNQLGQTGFNLIDSVPFRLTNTSSGAGLSELNFSLSALGDVSANGVQYGYVTVTLSANALSGNGSGGVEHVDVTNTSITLQTTITAALVPYATSPVTTSFSEPEAQRLRLLGYI